MKTLSLTLILLVFLSFAGARVLANSLDTVTFEIESVDVAQDYGVDAEITKGGIECGEMQEVRIRIPRVQLSSDLHSINFVASADGRRIFESFLAHGDPQISEGAFKGLSDSTEVHFCVDNSVASEVELLISYGSGAFADFNLLLSSEFFRSSWD